MDIKDIRLTKGMSKDEVNELVSRWLSFEDDYYNGNAFHHKWKCKCGNVFNRIWGTIRCGAFDCGCIKYNEVERRYKEEVEKDGEYEYIKSFRCGDTLPNGRVIRSPYLRIKHKHCGSVYEIGSNNFIKSRQRCNYCCGSYENSFAYHIEVELGLDVNDVWDFEKNTVNPYHISKYMNSPKVWIKCQNEDVNELNGLMKKDYHPSYEITCAHFSSGKRCSYCKGQYKVHPYDSFGYHNFDKVQSWHPDNDISPFKVARNSGNKYKFVCDVCESEWKSDPRHLNRDRWCPVCNMSKGEKKVLDFLDYNNMNYINNYEYFTNLRGVGGGILRPDFILPNEKIWIEYDGEFHYKDVYKDGTYNKQKYHDKLKDEYAKKHGWKMIRIPYWEFDNIENILKREIS